MEITEFDPKHLEPLRQLYLESRAATFTWLDSQAYELSDFDRDTEGEEIWVAMESDEVVGFISIWSPDGFIHHLFVSPDYRNTGAGSRLSSSGDV